MQAKELLLTIDSTSKIWSVSVFADEIELQTIVGDENTPLSKYLVPQINEIIDSNNLKINNISKIGICLGPGSFTGIRVGISVGQALAQAIKCECVGVSLLEVLGFTIKKKKSVSSVVSLVTTNQNQVYFQLTNNKNNTFVEEGISLSNIQSFFPEFYEQKNVIFITNQESFNKLSQLMTSDILSQIRVAPSNLSQTLGRELSKKSPSIQIRKPQPIYI